MEHALLLDYLEPLLEETMKDKKKTFRSQKKIEILELL